jgi:hypothetical protein
MINNVVMILIFSFQCISAMNESDSALDFSSMSLSIEEQRKVYLPKELSDRSNRISIQDLKYKKMFDRDEQAINIFKNLNEDEALRLYCALKPIKQSGKSVVPLLLASEKDRNKVLNIMYPLCSCLPLIMSYHKHDELKAIAPELREYLAEKKVRLVRDIADMTNDLNFGLCCCGKCLAACGGAGFGALCGLVGTLFCSLTFCPYSAALGDKALQIAIPTTAALCGCVCPVIAYIACDSEEVTL